MLSIRGHYSPLTTTPCTAQLSSMHIVPDACYQTELDSHADTCVLSPRTCLVIHDHGRTIQVSGYDNGPTKPTCVIDAVIAYDYPATNKSIMLVIH